MRQASRFLAPVVSAVDGLLRFQDICFQQIVEILCVVGHLCGAYGFVLAVRQICMEYKSSALPFKPLGLVELIIEKMVALLSGLNNGPVRRCQNFCNALQGSAVVHNCRLLGHLVRNQWSRRSINRNQHERETSINLMYILARDGRNMGVFSSQHVAQCASLLGLAPSFFTDFALIQQRRPSKAKQRAVKHLATQQRPPSKTKQRRPSKARKPKLTPNLDAYVNGKQQRESGRKKTPLLCDKMACVLSSVTRHYCEELHNGMITESCLENMWCESHREKSAMDSFFPGGRLLARTTLGPHNAMEWVSVYPRVSRDGGIEYSTTGVSLRRIPEPAQGMFPSILCCTGAATLLRRFPFLLEALRSRQGWTIC